ncbi:MAG: class I SAM-dependent methyltransferase [Pirellulales bacterium]|nr:class I SAM-dependent methyltransferase [Pirellulales bacterium]
MTASWPDYELIDFGAGRKLERFGAWVLDRPCPAATGETVAKPQAWGEAVAKYDATRVGGGCWIPQLDLEDQHDSWCHVPVAAGFRLFVYPRPAGQVGVFPEQFSNWQWIAKQVARTQESLRVLNLFAYTGGSTLAAAVAGAEVTHVDAAKQAIERASFNANQEYPIRWIVEDVLKFCQREVRRGNRYDAVILDPPSYGHGPKGEEWLIQRDLLPLLQLCGELTSERRAFVLCTCHTPDIGPAELSAYLSDGLFGHCSQPPRSGKLFLQTAEGRKLPSGVFARWPE